MAKSGTQGQARPMAKMLRALRRKDYEGVVARAREYFGPANELADGAKLNVLRVHMGRTQFGKFMGTVLPRLGISRSTAYRWARQALGLKQQFKNPVVRACLMQVGRGRGILTVDGKHLTPSVQRALKRLPPEPRNRDNTKAEQWATQLLASAARVRARARIRLSSAA